jgi:N-acetylglutamate synthase-like GNAT family acetyltransferase
MAVLRMNPIPIVKEYHHLYHQQVVNLILKIQQQEYLIPITKEDQPDLFSIESFYQTGKGNFWIALHEGEVVGTISLLDLKNNEVALRKMFVHKGYRGQTYKTASLLLEKALTWAQEQSIKAIYLGTTPQFLAAHRFYEKNGFVEITQTKLPQNFPVLTVDKKFYTYILNK